MITREELIAQLEPIARNVFSNNDLKMTDDLGPSSLDTWTSLSFTQFLSAIEEKFSFRFKMLEIISMQNMGAIISTTLKHLTNA